MSATRPRILVVDDDELLRTTYRRILRDRFAVEVADSGESGLLALRRENGYDAILCDVQMPDMDGQRFFEELIAMKPAYQDRVLFCTGGSASHRVQLFLAELGSRVLNKPCTCDELVAALHTVLLPAANPAFVEFKRTAATAVANHGLGPANSGSRAVFSEIAVAIAQERLP